MEQKWSGPYISRKAVEQFIEKGLNNPDKTKAFGHDAVEILTEVHYMPAEDVKLVNYGRWQHTVGMTYRCSNCKKETYMGDGMDYCPKCGAIMIGFDVGVHAAEMRETGDS